MRAWTTGSRGDGEGQAVDDDATECFALHVDALPEAGGAEEDGVGRGAELLEQGFARSGAVQQDGEIEHRQEALVEVAHLAVAGEEAEGAAAGDVEHAADALGGGLREVGLARVGHVGRQIEQGLLAVSEVRGHDQFAGSLSVSPRPRRRRMCSKPPCTVSVAEVRTTVGICSKTSSRRSSETSMGVAWREGGACGRCARSRSVPQGLKPRRFAVVSARLKSCPFKAAGLSAEP